jgi:hypothetical protein
MLKEGGRPAHQIGTMWEGRPRSLKGGGAALIFSRNLERGSMAVGGALRDGVEISKAALFELGGGFFDGKRAQWSDRQNSMGERRMPYMGFWGFASRRFPRHRHKRPRRPFPLLTAGGAARFA